MREAGIPAPFELLSNMSDHGLQDIVMFTIATGGYVPFVLNLHASLVRVGLGDELVVYSLDDEAQRKLSGAGIRSFRYAADPCQRWSDYGTLEFMRTNSFKYAVALEILKTDKKALYVDSDIVFLRDPIDYLHEVTAKSSAHLVIQFESSKNRYNAGFWLAMPARPVIELFSRVWSALQTATYIGDQEVLNERLPQVDGLTTYALDRDLFPIGNRFLKPHVDASGRLFDADSAYILHFTHLIGKEAKVVAMMEHNAIFYPGLAMSWARKVLIVRTRPIRSWLRRAGVLQRSLSGQ
jgi:hypothetical protein